MSLSKICVQGKVVKKPEKRFMNNQNNTPIAELWLRFEGEKPDGTPQPINLKVIAYGELATRICDVVKMNAELIVDGRLQINNYETKEGVKKRDLEINAKQVEILSVGELTAVGAGAGVAGDMMDEDEIPF
jgi:single-stranded DNA-binding protein